MRTTSRCSGIGGRRGHRLSRPRRGTRPHAARPRRKRRIFDGGRVEIAMRKRPAWRCRIAAGSSDLAALRRLPSAEIFRAAEKAMPEHDYGPVVDGVSLLMPPAAFYRRHGFPYGLLIGSNANEWYMYVNELSGRLGRRSQKCRPRRRGCSPSAPHASRTCGGAVLRPRHSSTWRVPRI